MEFTDHLDVCDDGYIPVSWLSYRRWISSYNASCCCSAEFSCCVSTLWICTLWSTDWVFAYLKLIHVLHDSFLVSIREGGCNPFRFFETDYLDFLLTYYIAVFNARSRRFLKLRGSVAHWQVHFLSSSPCSPFRCGSHVQALKIVLQSPTREV
jgi:hypothetical protein